jgi:hypothetical protein
MLLDYYFTFCRNSKAVHKLYKTCKHSHVLLTSIYKFSISILMSVMIVQAAIPIGEIDDNINILILLVILFLWIFEFHFGSVFKVEMELQCHRSAAGRCIVPKLYIQLNCSWGWEKTSPETCTAHFKKINKRKLLNLVGHLHSHNRKERLHATARQPAISTSATETA